MSRCMNPKNFHELVLEMAKMELGDWVENRDNGRSVEIGSMCGGRYELFEDLEFIGCVGNTETAAWFLTKGYNFNESAEEAARRRNKENFEESIRNGWIYGQRIEGTFVPSF